MTIEFYLTWLAVIFPLVYSPGPGNILCAVSGASNGFRGSVPFVLGLNFSYATWTLLIGFGLGALIEKYPDVFYYVQLAGCAYIFYLAMTFFLHKASKENKNATKLTFLDGIVSQALNVKGVSIVILMYSQFLISDNAILPQVIKLSIMLAALNLFTHFSWVLGGAWIVSKLASGRAVKIQNKIYGAMLFLVAIWLFPM
ncbi:MAG: LysE family translocator [Gammaproteobacteria bacterium WSBS_2016_MAG_OTU1]